jgi:outer membrane protein TolC
MKTPFNVIVFSLIGLSSAMLSSPAQAQTPPKLFEIATNRSAAYKVALSDLTQATTKLERVRNDPLAVKPELLNAQLELESAKANLTATGLELRRNLTREYNTWKEATQSLEVAKLRLQLSQGNLQAAQVRFKAGAINSVDLARAEADTRGAQVEVTNAESDLATAAANLRVRIGELPTPNAPAETTPKPDRKALEASLENHRSIVQARGVLERARLDVQIKDNDFTAPVEVQNARTVLENAERNLEDLRSNLKTALATTWDAYQAALSAVPIRERNVQVARDELAAQTQRFQKGLIPKLTLMGSQVQLETAQLALEQARNRVSLSILELAVTANLDLWAK